MDKKKRDVIWTLVVAVSITMYVDYYVFPVKRWPASFLRPSPLFHNLFRFIYTQSGTRTFIPFTFQNYG